MIDDPNVRWEMHDYIRSLNKKAPTHLDIIKEAYDKCGIEYVVKTNEHSREWQYLLFVGDSDERKEMEMMSSRQALNAARKFMEFRNGEIASY